MSQMFFTSKKGTTRGVVNLKPVVPGFLLASFSVPDFWLGHVLVIPERHAIRFHELNPEEVTDLWISAQEIGKVIEKHYKAGSLTFVLQGAIKKSKIKEND